MEWYIGLIIALILIIPLSIFVFFRAKKNIELKKLVDELTDLRHKELFILEEIERLDKEQKQKEDINKEEFNLKIEELRKERLELIEKQKKLKDKISKSFSAIEKKD
jgi:hypothetical protein